MGFINTHNSLTTAILKFIKYYFIPNCPLLPKTNQYLEKTNIANETDSERQTDIRISVILAQINGGFGSGVERTDKLAHME